MNEGNRALRRGLARIGDAKRSADTADLAAHLARSPGERLRVTLSHADAHLAAFPAAAGAEAEDALVWSRIRRRLP